MRVYNRYVLTVAIVLLLSTVALIAAGQESLSIYYSVYVIGALIVTEMYVYFNRKIRRGLHSVSIILLVGFVIVLGIQILKALAPYLLGI